MIPVKEEIQLSKQKCSTPSFLIKTFDILEVQIFYHYIIIYINIYIFIFIKNSNYN
jgi:hypothetical protein